MRSGFQDFLSLRIACQHLPDEIVEASQWCRQATNVLFLLFSQQPSSLSFPLSRLTAFGKCLLASEKEEPCTLKTNAPFCGQDARGASFAAAIR